MVKNTALVLEGGGFRGIFTAGILEVFLEKKLFFDSVYGVSAGASYAVSYLSRQHGRNLAVNDFISDKRYSSLRNLIINGSLFSWDFIFEEIPQKIISLDYETLFNSASNFFIVTSDCRTGKSEFFRLQDLDRKDFKTVLAASCSLPLISPMISYGEKVLMDGGLADSIPFEHALNKGHERVVVILTQPKGYSKGPLKGASFFKWYFRKHPKVYELLVHRTKQYNDAVLRLEQLEKEGVAYVIRPDNKLAVSRLENKPHKTAKVYEAAKEQANKEFSDLEKWINR